MIKFDYTCNDTGDDCICITRKTLPYGEDYFVIADFEYDNFVTELEAVARKRWPHKFEAYKLPDPKFVKVEVVGNKPYELKHFEDGSTAWVEQVLELNDVIKLDKELRQQQIPLNSKKP